MPLYHKELYNVMDIRFANWRELVTANMVTDLIFNQISASFPIYNNWTYITDTTTEFYDNDGVKDKYIKGAKSDIIIEDIRKVRKEFDAKLGEGIHEESVSDKLYESISDIQTNLALSNISILHTMEQVGNPFPVINYDARRLLPTSVLLHKLLDSKDDMCKFVFELLFASHSMHKKLGVIHNDIHINNMTYNINRNKLKDKPEYDLYHNDSSYHYFKSNNITGCLIDFSRVIYSKRAFDKVGVKEYEDLFFKEQYKMIMLSLSRFAKSFVDEHHIQLKAIIMTNLDMLFPVLSCIDFMSILRSIIFVMKNIIDSNYRISKGENIFSDEFHKTGGIFSKKTSKKTSKKVNPKSDNINIIKLNSIINDEIGINLKSDIEHTDLYHKHLPVNEDTIKLLESMDRYVTKYFMESLLKVVLIMEREIPDEDITYIGDKIFNESNYFDKYKKTDGVILNIYSTANEIRHSLIKYELYPPYLKFENLDKHTTTQSVEDAFKNYRNLINAKTTRPNLDTISAMGKQKDIESDGEELIIRSF